MKESERYDSYFWAGMSTLMGLGALAGLIVWIIQYPLEWGGFVGFIVTLWLIGRGTGIARENIANWWERRHPND